MQWSTTDCGKDQKLCTLPSAFITSEMPSSMPLELSPPLNQSLPSPKLTA